MDGFPAVLAAVGIFGAFAMIGMLAFGLGKADMRGDYHQCIELGAPQQNCIDKFLGKRE
jgi:hypothetical protein